VPELPEVEVTRRRIAPLLIGRRIRKVRTTGASYLFLTEPRVLSRRLRGRRTVRLERRGKYLLACFDDGRRLLLHLGMSGQLFSSLSASPRLLSSAVRAALAPEEQRHFKPDRHTHLQLAFEDEGPDVLLRDVRKFGKLRLLEAGEQEPRLAKLGIDALSVSGEHLYRASRKRRVAAKALLLDQSTLAGVGNIYADEALFLAGVRPRRRAERLTRAECEGIAQALLRVLRRAIETGGSSISDFVGPDGVDGSYQDERRVYAREDEPCLDCGAPIRRVVIGQRAAHYCPRCQR
jgi:formamidopyrimidine-DNA glycosylase